MILTSEIKRLQKVYTIHLSFLVVLIILFSGTKAQVKVYELKLTDSTQYDVSISSISDDSVFVKIDNSISRSFAIEDIAYLGTSNEVIIENGIKLTPKLTSEITRIPPPIRTKSEPQYPAFDSALIHPYFGAFGSFRSIGAQCGIQARLGNRVVPSIEIAYQQNTVRDGQFLTPSIGICFYAPVGARLHHFFVSMQGGYGFNVTNPQSFNFNGTALDSSFISKQGGSNICPTIGFRHVLKTNPNRAIEYGISFKQNKATFEYLTNLQLSNGEFANRLITEDVIYNRLELMVRFCL